MPLVIAHRGASGYAPENTLPAFRKALELNADMIELDVYTLADGEVVCFHDDGLERLTGGEGLITDFTLPELSQLRVAGKHPIPRLTEVLDLIARKLRINVELKGPGTAAPVHAIIEEYTKNHGWEKTDFLISSFRQTELRRMRTLDAEIPVGILPHDAPLAALEIGRELDAESINAYHETLDPESVRTIHDAGFRIYAWTVNEHADIHRLLELGIDGLITNYPDRVTHLAAER